MVAQLACRASGPHRTFLLLFGAVPCWPKLDPQRLAASHRLDVLCRCITSALQLDSGHKPRERSSIVAAFARPSWTPRLGYGLVESLDGQVPEGANPVGVMEIHGSQLEELRPDERWLALQLKRALETPSSGETSKLLPEMPGWQRWEVTSLRLLVQHLLSREPGTAPLGAPLQRRQNTRLLALREDADAEAKDELLRAASLGGVDHLIFVLGDHIGLRPMAFGRLQTDFGGHTISLGANALLTSQCITLLQYLTDTTFLDQNSLLKCA